MSQRSESYYYICSVCHKPNPVGKTYCQYCWSQITPGVKVNAEEADEILRQLQKTSKRRKRVKSAIFIFGLAVLATMITLVLYNYTDIFGKPPPGLNSNSPPGQWSMFRYDLVHSGTSSSDSPLPQGIVQWTFSTQGAIESSPAVVNGVVYIGSRDGKLYAVNAATGIKQWEYQAGSWIDSSPAVVNGIIYFGSNDGNLYALDAVSGKKLWSFKTTYPVKSSVAVAEGVVYFGADNYNIYALNAYTGQEIWHFKTDGNVYSSLAVANGIAYVGSEDGFLYALDARNGRLRLRFRSALIDTSPTVNGNLVYFGNSTGYLYTINGQARNWLFEYDIQPFWIQLWVMGLAPKPPALSGFVWEMKLGGVITSSPAVVNNTLYVGVDNSLIAIDTQNQKKIWSFKTDGSVRSSPAVSGNTVYFGSDDGRIYAVDAGTGKELWKINTGDKVGSSPALLNGILYVGSDNGGLYAIK